MFQRSAFTLVEFAMVVVVVAIITFAAIPDTGTEEREQGRIAADSFAAMVSFGRSLAIAQPDERIVLKLDVANKRYWIAKASSEDTPILHPLTKQPYRTTVGPGTKLSKVDFYAADFNGDEKLYIDNQGFLDQDQPAYLQLQVGTKQMEIKVDPAAGVSQICDGVTRNITPIDRGLDTGGADISGTSGGEGMQTQI